MFQANAIGLNMNSSSTMPANPPYIRFETRAIEKRKTATDGGGVYFEDRDYALVTPHGSKDTVEKDVIEWWDQLQEQVRQGRFPDQWFGVYKDAYKAWKSGQEIPVVGTPIKNWPVATPSEVKILLYVGLRAVEDLANANAELLGRIGMGANSLKQRAEDWVKGSQGAAPLVAQLDALRQVNKGQAALLEEMQDRLRVMEGRLEQREMMLANSARDGIPVNPEALEDRLASAKARVDDTMSDAAAIEDALAE